MDAEIDRPITDPDLDRSADGGFIARGPALPPGKSMRFRSRLIGKTKLRVHNEQALAGAVMIDGLTYPIPPREDSGMIDLSRWWFGKQLIVTNECDWVLRIEY